MKKTVIVVEDDEGLRDQLVKILKNAPDIECLGSLSSAEQALEKIPEYRPDVVLLDIKLPGMSGIDCLPELKQKAPSTEVLMLTINADAEAIFRALKAGASGYLLKSSPKKELFDAIRDVYFGGAPFSGPIARKIVRFFHSEGESDSESRNLAPRESEVLALLASGFINKEIAEKMDISLETVKTYIKRICAKMRVRSRGEAIFKYRSQPSRFG